MAQACILILIVNHCRIIEMKIVPNPVWAIGENVEDRVTYSFGNVGNSCKVIGLWKYWKELGTCSHIVSSPYMKCDCVLAANSVQHNSS